MFYIGIFLFFSFLVYINGSSRKLKSFYLLSLSLLLISIFRFGGGADYFNYFDLYLISPIGWDDFFSSLVYIRVEPLYLAFTIIAKKIGLSYPQFLGFVSSFILLGTIKTISKNSLSPLFSLILFFGFYYLVYVESAIRQGIAMTLFLYGYFNFYKYNKKKVYFIFVLIATFFHYSAIILFFISFLKIIKIETLIKPIILFPLIIFLFFFSFVFSKILFLVIGTIFSRYNTYNNPNMHIFAILFRGFNLILVIYLVSKVKNNLNTFEKNTVVLYICGILFYFLVSQISILSRLTEYFSLLEIIIFPNLISKLRLYDSKKFFKLLFIILSSFLFVKDISGNINNGKYYNKNILEYPYVTIFNKKDIIKYRDNTSKFVYYE